MTQVAEVTSNVASVLEMDGRGDGVICHKDGGYIQTMKTDDETMMKTQGALF